MADSHVSGPFYSENGFVGDLTGDVTGNVNGDVTGDLTGNVNGNVTGDVNGDVTGDLTGDVTGNVNGNVTGDLTGDVTGNVNGAITLPTYTVDTLPDATSFEGMLIRVFNGDDGDPCLALSDGTDWLRIVLGPDVGVEPG